jgi:hypothetical protein
MGGRKIDIGKGRKVMVDNRSSCRECAEIKGLHILIDERLDTYDKSQKQIENNSRWRMWIIGIAVSLLLTANLFLLNTIRLEISSIRANNFNYQQFMFQNQGIDDKLDWLVTQQQRLFRSLNKLESKHKFDLTPFPNYLGNVL